MDLQLCWRVDPMSSFKAWDQFSQRYFFLVWTRKGRYSCCFSLLGILVLESLCVES